VCVGRGGNRGVSCWRVVSSAGSRSSSCSSPSKELGEFAGSVNTKNHSLLAVRHLHGLCAVKPKRGVDLDFELLEDDTGVVLVVELVEPGVESSVLG